LASNVLFISPSPLLISPLPFGKGRETIGFFPPSLERKEPKEYPLPPRERERNYQISLFWKERVVTQFPPPPFGRGRIKEGEGF